jgi:hypothetical protein
LPDPGEEDGPALGRDAQDGAVSAGGVADEDPVVVLAEFGAAVAFGSGVGGLSPERCYVIVHLSRACVIAPLVVDGGAVSSRFARCATEYLIEDTDFEFVYSEQMDGLEDGPGAQAAFGIDVWPSRVVRPYAETPLLQCEYGEALSPEASSVFRPGYVYSDLH